MITITYVLIMLFRYSGMTSQQIEYKTLADCEQARSSVKAGYYTADAFCLKRVK